MTRKRGFWKFWCGEKLLTERFEDINPRLTRNYVFAVDFVEGKKVLDIGCAGGYGGNYLVERGSPVSVTGLDISPRAVASARERYQHRNLRFVRGNGVALPFENESFDVVCAFEIIEHVDDYNLFLEEIQRVLRPDGRLLLSTPNKAITSPDTPGPIMIDHVKEFFVEELEALLKGIFGEVKMLGQSPTDPRYFKVREAYGRSLRFKITKGLSQIEVVRQIAKYTPVAIKDLVTGSPKPWIRLDEVAIVESPDGAITTVAVCRYPKKR